MIPLSIAPDSFVLKGLTTRMQNVVTVAARNPSSRFALSRAGVRGPSANFMIQIAERSVCVTAAKWAWALFFSLARPRRMDFGELSRAGVRAAHRIPSGRFADAENGLLPGRR